MRSRYRLVTILAMVAAVVIACKQQSVANVTIDLGFDNLGSQGFACTEDRSEVCAQILDCAFKPLATVQTACLSALCRQDGGVVARECAAFVACRRDTDAAVADCYNETCQRPRGLIERARNDGGADVHLLVDYIGLGGTPGCRLSELRSWCGAGRCAPTRRRCVALHLEPDVLGDSTTWSRAISEGFAQKLVLDDDAPDGPVIVRVVGVARSGACTPEETALEAVPSEQVIGCAYSCPVVLSVARGALTVDLDLLGGLCTDHTISECVDGFAAGGDASSP